MPLSAGLRAAGDVKFTMWASLFCTVVCRTFLSFLLTRQEILTEKVGPKMTFRSTLISCRLFCLSCEKPAFRL